MAKKTPSSVTRFNWGSVNAFKVVFSDIDNSDTYVSGLTGVLGQWANKTDEPGSQGNEGIAVSHSSGTFTFYAGETNNAVELYVLAND